MLVHALTIFTGAFLLFEVQPLIAKYILPWFGGGPGVWTTCMLFFQVLLLGGYAYAHFLSSRLRPRGQAMVHLVLLAGALALLPITPGDSWKPHESGNPTLQILVLLTVCLGLPYFVLSSTGPLLQHWFSRTSPGRSPYRLYALSNAGSLLALVSYPLFFETCFTRKAQAGLWAWGLAAYAVCSAVCAVRVWKAGGEDPKAESPPPPEVPSSTFDVQRSMFDVRPSSPLPAVPGTEGSTAENAEFSPTHHASRITPPPSPLNRLLWLLLPACASVLLLATTNKMCQDVAVIPFLWVLPLALYLLSFVICFDNPRWYARWPFALALVAALGSICWALSFKLNEGSVFVQLGIFSAGLFTCCMVCHGELYRLRPDPRHLTRFYLMIAAGGALGGLFVAVIAPLIFTDYFELHWGLLLCGLLFLVVCLKSLRPRTDSGFPKMVAADVSRRTLSGPVESAPTDVGGYDCLSLPRPRPSPLAPRPSSLVRWRWAGCGLWAVGLMALGVALWIQAGQSGSGKVCRSRNFYGVLSVLKLQQSGWDCLKLAHGRTAHGLQFLDPVRATWPTLYFSEKSGVGLAVRTLPAGPRRIGVVGLGTGTLAAYGRPGDYLRMYEINPEVERLARSWFTYLTNCPGKVEVVLGDARLSLEREPDQRFDLLVLDAFNSDAVPVHLLTREAFAVYERHLATNGIIAVHVSNVSLSLEPVVANLARHYHYKLAAIDNLGTTDEWWVYSSEWILLTRNEQIINSPAIRAAARPTETRAASVPIWTDDFASLFQILRWNRGAKGEPGSGAAQVEMAQRLFQQGDSAGAVARYRLALQGNPGLVPALNNLAWILATSPEAALRDGPEAVRMAEGACRTTQYKQTIMVGTLAAAYAEAGRFPEAVTTAEMACTLATEAGDQALLARNQELLELYRARQPYHEPASP